VFIQNELVLKFKITGRRKITHDSCACSKTGQKVMHITW